MTDKIDYTKKADLLVKIKTNDGLTFYCERSIIGMPTKTKKIYVELASCDLVLFLRYIHGEVTHLSPVDRRDILQVLLEIYDIKRVILGQVRTAKKVDNELDPFVDAIASDFGIVWNGTQQHLEDIIKGEEKDKTVKPSCLICKTLSVDACILGK